MIRVRYLAYFLAVWLFLDIVYLTVNRLWWWQ